MELYIKFDAKIHNIKSLITKRKLINIKNHKQIKKENNRDNNYPVRTTSIKQQTTKLEKQLRNYRDNKHHVGDKTRKLLNYLIFNKLHIINSLIYNNLQTTNNMFNYYKDHCTN